MKGESADLFCIFFKYSTHTHVMMKVCLLLILFYSDLCPSMGKSYDQPHWAFSGRHDILFPSSISRERTYGSCQHCFHVQTVGRGHRMVVEPCGGSGCISMINNTELEEEDQPTEKYDLEQCGMIKTDRTIVNKALQLKISTGVKSTLRPAEYPWLVSLFICFLRRHSPLFLPGSY